MQLLGLSPYLFAGFVIWTLASIHLLLAPFMTFLVLYRSGDPESWVRDIFLVWFVPIFGSFWMAWKLRNDAPTAFPAKRRSLSESPSAIEEAESIDWAAEIRSLQQYLDRAG